MHQNDSIQLNCIWDTGSARSFISSEIAQLFNLEKKGTSKVTGMTGTALSEVYEVTLLIFDNYPFTIDVKSFKKSEERKFDFLIGMDIISLGNLSINTNNGHTVLQFEYNPFKGFSKVFSTSNI